jgi:hypothetical protein
MARGNEYMSRGNELMAEVREETRLSWEQRPHLRRFIEEQTVRAECVADRQVAASTA